MLANVFLEVGTLHGCLGTFPKKQGGIQVLAGACTIKLFTAVIVAVS